jgi:hypothetical protein
MALTTPQRSVVWRSLLDQDATLGQTFTKPDLDAAVSAVDTWCTNNQASFLNAIPAPFTSATAQQKALLLAYVALKRTGVI